MYHTTGYTRDQITDLCAMVYQEVAAEGTLVWPPVLGLFIGPECTNLEPDRPDFRLGASAVLGGS